MTRNANIRNEQRKLKILRLPIKTEWLDMIDAGIKTDEYREIKRHYISRFFTPVQRDLLDLFEMSLNCANNIHAEAADFGCRVKDFDAVELIAGYSRTSRRSVYEFKGLSVQYGKPGWGAPTDRKVFAIILGKRLW